MEGEGSSTKGVQGIADVNKGVHRATVDEWAMKPNDNNRNNDDAGSNDESTAFLTLGSPKMRRKKSSNDDDELGEALQNMLSSKINGSPLPFLRGGEADPNNELDFGETDDEDEQAPIERTPNDTKDYLNAFNEDEQTPINNR
jgi:hypothetical protein